MPTCPKCHADNHDQARFCQNCASNLAANNAQGKTVALPPQTGVLPNIDVRTIVQRTQQAFGTSPMQVLPMTRAIPDQRQHEQTVFVVDVSGSMSESYDSRFTKIEAAVRANSSMVLEKSRLDDQDEIGLVLFKDWASTHLPLCTIASHRPQILSSLQTLSSGSGTDIDAGLKEAGGVFDWCRTDVVRRIVLLTDGHGGHPLSTAQDLKSKGVVIDVIGVGSAPSGVDEKLLRKVASIIEGECRYRFIKDQQTLVAHYTQLANKTATGT